MTTEYINLPLYSLKLVRSGKVRYAMGKCSDPETTLRVLHTYLWDKECEHLIVLLLDGHHNYLGLFPAAHGGVHGLHIAVRDVFKGALLHRASAIILSHNHPSGDPTPSAEDIHFTKQCVDAGKILGCPVVDHIVVSSGVLPGHYSMLTHGLM
jgi:DNA repair protein RadC